MTALGEVGRMFECRNMGGGEGGWKTPGRVWRFLKAHEGRPQTRGMRCIALHLCRLCCAVLGCWCVLQPRLTVWGTARWSTGLYYRTTHPYMGIVPQAYDEICKHYVSENILTQYMYKTMNSTNNMWVFKKQFTLSMAMMGEWRGGGSWGVECARLCG